MRPIDKGNIPIGNDGNPIVFAKYERARQYLIERIGEYCSYCERKIEANLAVEHVQPKSLKPDLELNWDNFLLACTNCNSTKGNKPITLDHYFWPDRDNTYIYFDYDHTGVVSIPANITDSQQRQRIQATLDLVGLQVIPPSEGTVSWQTASDRRYRHRLQAWITASDILSSYDLADHTLRAQLLPLILIIVENQGFWSIWIKIFNDHPEVTKALYIHIPGTKIYSIDSPDC